MQIRVSRLGQLFEHKEVADHGQQTTQHDDGLAAYLVGQSAEDDEERCADDEGCRHKQVGSRPVNFERLGQEKQRIELAGVPDHGLSGGQTDQGQNHDLQVFPLTERLGQRSFGGFAFGFHFGESRRLVHRQTDINRHGQQSDGDQERNAPAPGFKGLFADGSTRAQNH